MDPSELYAIGGHLETLAKDVRKGGLAIHDKQQDIERLIAALKKIKNLTEGRDTDCLSDEEGYAFKIASKALK